MPRSLPLRPRPMAHRVVAPRFVAPRLVVPRPSVAQNLILLPRHALAGVRLYRRTPARLRRIEPASRVAVSAVVLWFSVLFVALSVLVGRVVGARATNPSAAIPIRGGAWLSFGYLVAALLGPPGLALFLTRRHRCGLAALAAMFVVAQVMTLIAVL